MESSIIIDMHGYANIIGTGDKDDDSSSRVMKNFWRLIIGTLGIVAMIGIVRLCSITGTTAVRTTVQHLPEVRMPDVALCLQHAWERDPENFSATLEAQMPHFHKTVNESFDHSDTLWADVFDAVANGSIEDFYRTHLMSCESVMIFCQFKQTIFNCCNPETTFRYFNQRDYMCLIVESAGYQKILDPMHGLIMVLRAQGLQNQTSDFYKFITAHKGGSIARLDHYLGAIVFLASIFREYQSNMIVAAPGSWTHIVFEQKDVQRVVDCNPSPPTFATTHGCYEACFRHIIVKECGCLHMANLDRADLHSELVQLEVERLARLGLNQSHVDMCNPFTLNTCLTGAARNYTDTIADCYEYTCRNCCRETVYRTSATFALLNKQWAAEMLEEYNKGRLEHQVAKPDDLAYISIASGQLGKTCETEFHIMDPVSYISMVGGQLGLWLGWSVITILQLIIAAVVTLAKRLMRRKKSSRKITMVPEKT